jgi:hypothetical protein
VVPPAPPEQADAAEPTSEHEHGQGSPNAAAPSRSRYRPWRELLMRTFAVDLRCKRCGRPMQLKAFITSARSLERLCRKLGDPTAPPERAPARGPPTSPARWCAALSASSSVSRSYSTERERGARGAAVSASGIVVSPVLPMTRIGGAPAPRGEGCVPWLCQYAHGKTTGRSKWPNRGAAARRSPRRPSVVTGEWENGKSRASSRGCPRSPARSDPRSARSLRTGSWQGAAARGRCQAGSRSWSLR